VIDWPDGILSLNKMLLALVPQPLNDKDLEMLHKGFSEIQDYFLEVSRREALAGAEIVVWPEINLLVFTRDEADFMDRAQQFASQERIYLLMGMGTIQLGDQKPLTNKAVLLIQMARPVTHTLRAFQHQAGKAIFRFVGMVVFTPIIPNMGALLHRSVLKWTFRNSFARSAMQMLTPFLFRRVTRSQSNCCIMRWRFLERLKTGFYGECNSLGNFHRGRSSGTNVGYHG